MSITCKHTITYTRPPQYKNQDGGHGGFSSAVEHVTQQTASQCVQGLKRKQANISAAGTNITF